MERRRLSPGERLFVRDGVEASGSARVVLDTTDVLVGIKAEFGEPDSQTPDLGRVLCSVECAASASQDFEGRGSEDLNLELSQILEHVLSTQGCLDLKSLCIIPRQQCWVLYVDVVVLDFGGNVVDAMVMAARAALADLRIPNVTVEDADTSQPSIEVSDDPMDVRALDVSKVPLSVTVYKIGPHMLVDPTLTEEACADAALVVAVNKAGNVCMVRKRGRGGIDPRLVMDMIKTGRKIALTLIEKLDKALVSAAAAPRVGFFADRFFAK